MFLKKIISTVIAWICFVQNVSGASYSRVYVQRGLDVDPYQYYNYGAPGVNFAGPQLAQISAAPVDSVLPLPQPANFIPQCVAPCVPTQSIIPIANPGLVAYSAPSVVVAKDEPPASYQYSYLVYDPNTGDQKAVNELSDGGLVRGQYSLLQPDGYIQEVKYTADDISGYNAVVRRFLPEGGVRTVEPKEPKPCTDPKSSALKEQPQGTRVQGAAPPQEEKGLSEAPVNKAPEKGEAQELGAKESPTPEKTPPQEKTASEGAGKKEPLPEKKEQSEAPKTENLPEKTRASNAPDGEVATVKEEPSKQAKVTQESPPPISYATYSQLMKCIQAMKNGEQRTNSPLTYILLPSYPC